MSITNNLGRVMPVDKGAYNVETTYMKLDMVHTSDSTYVSKVDDNVGHAVTDTNYWQCYADGKPATAAASTANTAAGAANDAAAAANAAAARAPYIGDNGNWYIWSVEGGAFVDSGIDATAPELTIGNDYTIYKDGVVFTTAIKDAAEQAAADHAQYLLDHASIASKANVASGAVAGHVATLDASGNPTESGLDADDIALKDGYYQQLVAGNAENMIDTKGQGTEQEFTRRTSCGDQSIADDGAAIFKSIRGKSIVWNQGVAIKSSDASVSDNNVTITDNRDGSYTVQTTNDGASAVTQVSLSSIFPYVKGRKILIKGCPAGGASASYSLLVSGSYTEDGNPKRDIGDGNIFTVGTNSNVTYLRLNVASGAVITTPVVFVPQLYDLTFMFGEGKEPSTVAEFEAMYAAKYYAFKTGKIINNAVEHYITDGFQRYNHETGKAYLIKLPSAANGYQITGAYTALSFTGESGETTAIIPDASGHFNVAEAGELTVTGGDASTTCVHIVWSGYRNGEYEPYWKRDTAFALLSATGKLNGEGSSVVVAPGGARSAGDAFDEWVVENGYITKFIKRIDSVDLGTLYWSTAPNQTKVFRNRMEGKRELSGAGSSNLVCSKYATTIRSSYADAAALDKVICEVSATTSDTYIAISDSAFDGYTGTQVATALSGQMLNYELAEPEVYILDEPIFIGTPKVADFGTETAKECLELDVNGVPKSAPFRAVIKYSTDYPREIANLPKEYDTIDGLDDLCAALATALGSALNGTLAITRGAYDSANQKYAWTVTFTPNGQGE